MAWLRHMFLFFHTFALFLSWFDLLCVGEYIDLELVSFFHETTTLKSGLDRTRFFLFFGVEMLYQKIKECSMY